MKGARTPKQNFKLHDYVALKINREDKANSLHPNVLLGKIEELEKDYTKISTKFGLISTYISTNRLSKIEKPNISFEHSKEITLTKAWKMASEQ